jgi:hypothetical protein
VNGAWVVVGTAQVAVPGAHTQAVTVPVVQAGQWVFPLASLGGGGN